MDIIWTLLLIYAAFVITWVLYVASMQFLHFRDDLYPVAKAHAYLVGGVMIALDFLINIFMSVPLLEPPRYDKGEFLLSPRLKRWNKTDSWRGRFAAWICEHFLNQFDRSGDHC